MPYTWDTTKPAGSDLVSTGDDQMRADKTTLQTFFQSFSRFPANSTFTRVAIAAGTGVCNGCRITESSASASGAPRDIQFDATGLVFRDTKNVSVIVGADGQTPSRLTVYAKTVTPTSANAILYVTGTGKLVAPTNGVAGGLQIGADCDLYRHSANVLATPDAFGIGGKFYATAATAYLKSAQVTSKLTAGSCDITTLQAQTVKATQITATNAATASRIRNIRASGDIINTGATSVLTARDVFVLGNFTATGAGAFRVDSLSVLGGKITATSTQTSALTNMSVTNLVGGAAKFSALQVTGTVTMSGGQSLPTKTISSGSSYTVLASDCVLLCSSPAGTLFISLPSATVRAGRILYIKRAAGVVTLVPESGERIDGQTTINLNETRAALMIVSDGANWHIIGGYRE